MTDLAEKFRLLGTDYSPGQETRRATIDTGALRGETLAGTPVDFSHGDVDAFEPPPGSLDLFIEGVRAGGQQAYTEYRGSATIRRLLSDRLATLVGTGIDGLDGMILTPGTQGALFLAMASTVGTGDKVAIVEPDYFANRKLVHFLGGTIVPVPLDYLGNERRAGLDLQALESAFRSGARTFVFSNPNNPVGVIYSEEELREIGGLAERYGVVVIVDQLYSRLLYDDRKYISLCGLNFDPDKVITIMGPSKTESLSGYRLGVAFGSTRIIGRMEKLQAIVSLRAAGYNQSVLRIWLSEPNGWLAERIVQHQHIRDALLDRLGKVSGVTVRKPEAGSYVFPQLPSLDVSYPRFVDILRHQAGVTVTPGTEFSTHSAASIRLNFSQDRGAAVAAVERLSALIDRYRSTA